MSPPQSDGPTEVGAQAGPATPTFDAKEAVNIPAIMLIATAALSALLSLAALASSDEGMMEAERALHPDRVYLGGGSLIPRWANLIPLFFSGTIAWGAWQMRGLKRYWLAVSACSMSMIPCFMPCCFVSLPASIWGLVMLLKPEVKAAFISTRVHDPLTGPAAPATTATEPAIDEAAVKRAVASVRLVFWGGFLLLFEFGFTSTTQGRGFKFDLLNDAVGTTLIAMAAFRMNSIAIHGRYATATKFGRMASVLAVLNAVREHFVWQLPPPVDFALGLAGFILALATLVALCIAFQWFCAAANWLKPSRSWSVTALLSILCLVPVEGPRMAAALTSASGTETNLKVGVAGPLLLLVFATHWMVSAWRMGRAAQGPPEL